MANQYAVPKWAQVADAFAALGGRQGNASEQALERMMIQEEQRRRAQVAQQILDRNRQQVPGTAQYLPSAPQGVPHQGAQYGDQQIGSGLLGHMPTQGKNPTMAGLLAAEAARSGDYSGAGSMLGMGTQGDLPAAVREFQYVQKLSPEQREMYYKVKRGQPGIRLSEVPLSDGSKMTVLHDPQSGAMYTLEGQLVNEPVRPTEGQTGPQGGGKATPKEGARIGQTPTPGEKETAKQEAKTKAEKKANWDSTADKYRNLESKWSTVTETIDEAIDDTSWFTTGPAGQLMSSVPGTPQKDYYEMVQTIKANIGFDELQRMRDASPTGGALGQVSEMENKLLQAVQGSLEVGQSPSQMRKNLMNIKKRLNDLREAKRRAYLKDRKKFGDPSAPAIEGPDVGEGDDPLGLYNED